MQIAKGLGITIFIVGHVTKEGNVAGTKGAGAYGGHQCFILRETGMLPTGSCVPSRTDLALPNEIGVFEMRESGLEEVSNPSSTF